MPRAKKPLTPEKPQLTIHSVTLTAEEVEIVRRFSQYASDTFGRSISNSAVIRALVHQMGRMEPPAIDALFLEIERELNAGVWWGKQK